MIKGKFLTRRWNNLLTLGLGLPALVYGVIVMAASVFSAQAGFIGIVVIGVIY